MMLPSVVETKYYHSTRMDFQTSPRRDMAVGESGRPHFGDDFSSQWINPYPANVENRVSS
jgi:hypothetical protein